MRQREINRWRKALERTRIAWEGARWDYNLGWIAGQCVLCKTIIKFHNRQCKYCPAFHLPMVCDDYNVEADEKHSRRPIYAAIRKMHRYLDDQEAKNKKRRED